jgi:hypothetical protein
MYYFDAAAVHYANIAAAAYTRFVCIHTTQEHLDNSKAVFEQVTARVLREFERFRREKAADIRQVCYPCYYYD